MGQRIESFRELKVSRSSFELQQEIFDLTKKFPQEERFSLVQQIRSSSRSIGANISESWHKRRYAAHFVSKLTDADAEQAETQHWLDTAHACEYISSEDHGKLVRACMELGRMLGRMMEEPDKWCGRFTRKV